MAFILTLLLMQQDAEHSNGEKKKGSGFCPSSGILKTRKCNVSEIGSVSVFRCGERRTYSVGSLRKSA
jgi:hypothetical protein